MIVAIVLSTCTAAGTPSVPVPGGLQMPYVSLGTGSGQHGDVVNATQLWVQAGGVGIDTAFDYEDESDIATGLKRAGKAASSMFITTKIPCASYSKAKSDIASNLQQLQVESVDLTLIHFPRCGFGASVADTWRALEEAKAAGQTKAIGVSHFTQSDFETLKKTSKVDPVVNQCSYSVGYHDDDTIKYCDDNNIVYMSYSPLCGGANGSSCQHGNVMTIPEVVSIAAKHSVSTAQVALKWLAQQGRPIACASWRQDYMQEDLDLWSWGNLTDDEMDTLTAVKA
eukprot:g4853.t1